MSEVANIYDNGPISPIAKIKENLSVWTVGQWSHFEIQYIEPMPRSSPMMVEMVTLSGGLTIAANGIIASTLINVLELNKGEFLHLRFLPIDDMEGILWEQRGQGRFVTRSAHARVTLGTPAYDPNCATTTFFILGRDLDPYLEVRNPNPVVWPVARFMFWGYRYLLKKLPQKPSVTTWVPAEGSGGLQS